jgi:hypothetical protein
MRSGEQLILIVQPYRDSVDRSYECALSPAPPYLSVYASTEDPLATHHRLPKTRCARGVDFRPPLCDWLGS